MRSNTNYSMHLQKGLGRNKLNCFSNRNWSMDLGQICKKNAFIYLCFLVKHVSFDINLKKRLIANRLFVRRFFCVKVVFKKNDFFIVFFVYNFSHVFSKFQKNLYESCLCKRQLSRVFQISKKFR